MDKRLTLELNNKEGLELKSRINADKSIYIELSLETVGPYRRFHTAFVVSEGTFNAIRLFLESTNDIKNKE